MQGKIDSKTRILISMFKKYKKSIRSDIVLFENDFVFRKERYAPGIESAGWSKTYDKEHGLITRFMKTLPYFQYTIKEGFELSIH